MNNSKTNRIKHNKNGSHQKEHIHGGKVSNQKNVKGAKNSNLQKKKKEETDEKDKRVKKGQKLKYSFNDFHFLDILGVGAFSQVRKTVFKQTGKLYATKIINKSLIIKRKKSEMVKIEKRAYQVLRHVGITRLHCTFHDKENLYFVLEYVTRGELFNLLKKKKKLSIKVGRYFFAQIINVMEYIHGQNWVHLDIKPENILINEKFHIKFIDFGTAIFLDNPNKKILCIGTPEYMSPEMVRANNVSVVSKACDLWSFGILVYRCMIGEYPFRSKSTFMIFQAILANEYKVPEDLDKNVVNLIQKLLVSDPKKRLGVESYKDLKGHPFFKGIDFAKVYEMEIPKELLSFKK